MNAVLPMACGQRMSLSGGVGRGESSSLELIPLLFYGAFAPYFRFGETTRVLFESE